MKLVEITGIPGCGKSTIFPIVEEYFINMGLKVFNPKSILQCSQKVRFSGWHSRKVIALLPMKVRNRVLRGLATFVNLKQQYALKYMTSNPELLSYVVGLTNSRPVSEDHKRLTLGYFLNLTASYQIACESLGSDSVLLADEGFVHKVVTFFVSVQETTIDPAEVQRYLEKIPAVHTLIKVKADVSVCKKRLIPRKLPRRLEGSTENEIEEYLLRSKAAIDCAEDFQARRGTKIVSLDNSSEQFSEVNVRSQLLKSLKDIELEEAL